MKNVLNIVILLIMASSILVQYNDPDGILWALVYGYGTVMAWNAVRNRYDIPLLVIGIVASVVGGYLLLPHQFLYWITNEVARETGGLFMTAICLSAILAQPLLGGSAEGNATPVEA